jgi:hypothetical protein
MRARVLLTLLAGGFLALFFSATAFADTFPDLPGMGVADEATAGKGEGAAVSGSTSGSTPQNAQAKPSDTDSVIDDAVDPAKVKPVRDMPGGNSMPIINQVDLTRLRTGTGPMPRALTALAAIGTLLSVGAFLILRDRLPER